MSTFDPVDLDDKLEKIADKIISKKIKKVLFIPPDITRLSSGAGIVASRLCGYLWNRQQDLKIDFLPAIGTHREMSTNEKKIMFGEKVTNLCTFYSHDSQKKLSSKTCYFSLEEMQRLFPFLPAFLQKPIRFSVSKYLKDYDEIISIGQVIPHEVLGMANYTKNVVIGTGDKRLIDFSHIASALFGIENLIGEEKNPLRNFIDLAFEKLKNEIFGNDLIRYILFVSKKGLNTSNLEKDDGNEEGGSKPENAFYYVEDGFDKSVFSRACEKAREINIRRLGKRYKNVIAHVPNTYRSLWLSNKAIYRSRQVLSSGGHLYINAPGLDSYAENSEAEKQIGRVGYLDREIILEELEKDRLSGSVAAHLLHGCPGKKFSVAYIINNHSPLSKEKLNQVGYQYLSELDGGKIIRNLANDENSISLRDTNETTYIE